MSGLGRAYLVRADVRGTLPLADHSVQCVVTSPPYYGLRDYGDSRQIGLEPTPGEYVACMVSVFREVRRVLRDDGVLWLNLGDSYTSGGRVGHGVVTSDKQRSNRGADGKRDSARPPMPPGLKPKDIIGMPWRVAFALQADGWYLRSDCIWAKPNPMPESVTDRPTKAHEYVFLLTKRERYFYDAEAERVTSDNPVTVARKGRTDNGSVGTAAMWGDRNGQSGKGANNAVRAADSANLRTVWTLSTRSYPGAHFATFPPELPARCIRLGTSEKGACPACGAPWRRVLAKDRKPTRPGDTSKVWDARKQSHVQQGGKLSSTLGSIIGNRDPARHVTTSSTVGWEPSCSCDAGEPVPCVVLDPFSGSGTTAAVARELGRVGIGTEVNPEYLELARARVSRKALGRDNPALAASSSRLSPMPGQQSLFDVAT